MKKRHAQWLRANQHMRYMWIPHTDAIVVVTANPLPEGGKVPKQPGSYSDAEKTAAFQQLLQVTIRLRRLCGMQAEALVFLRMHRLIEVER